MANELENESRSEVQKIVEEMKDSSITIENYGAYVNKVKTSQRVISAQIENVVRDIKILNRKYDEKKEDSSTKRAEEEGFMPIAMAEILIDMNESIKDAYSWQNLEVQLFEIIYEKILALLSGMSAIDVKRDMLKEMREMETKRNNMFLEESASKNSVMIEIVNNKLRTIDDKIINLMKLLQEQNRQEKISIVNTFSDIMKMSNKEKKELFDKLNVESAEAKAMKKSISNEIEEVEMETQQIKKREDDIVEIDDDPFAEEDEDEVEEDKNDEGDDK